MNGDIVAFKAKVLSKSEIEHIYSHFMKKQLTKCDVVADATGAITPTFWETHIDQLSTGSSIYFKALKLNYYNKKYHISNKSTKIDT